MKLKCDATIVKGSRKGSLCNKTVIDGTRCKLHIEVPKCKVMVYKGTSRHICNKNIYIDSNQYCKTHYMHEINKPSNPYYDNEFDAAITRDGIYSKLALLKTTSESRKFLGAFL